MITVVHPTFADVQHTVPDDKVDDWVETGWVAQQPPNVGNESAAGNKATSEISETTIEKEQTDG